MLLLTTSTWTPAALQLSWTWLSLHLQASTHLLQVKYSMCISCLTHYTKYNHQLFWLISLPIKIGFTFYWLILFQMHPLEFVWYIFIMHRKLKVLCVMPYYTLYNSQASINNCKASKSVNTCWFFCLFNQDLGLQCFTQWVTWLRLCPLHWTWDLPDKSTTPLRTLSAWVPTVPTVPVTEINCWSQIELCWYLSFFGHI